MPMSSPVAERRAAPVRAPRVLFVNHGAALGGGELSLLDVVGAFRDGGLVALFSDGPFRERLDAASMPVAVLPAGQAVLGVTRGGRGVGPRTLLGLFGLARRVARMARDFDVVYANSQKGFIVGAVAGRMAGRPVVWHLRDVLSKEHFGRTNIRVAVSLANRCAACVVANSQATADAFVDAGGRRSLVQVVHNGLDAAPFDAVGAERIAALRQELGVGDAPLLGVFGRLHTWKGQHVAIEAMARLRERRPDAHLAIVGDALFGEHEYRAALVAQAERLGLADRVHFLGFRNDVPALMRTVDVVLHTSTAAEPFGRVIVEAMLARRPVIASAEGGALEIVEPSTTGLLIPPGDPITLAASIVSLLADPAAQRRMGERGRERAEERFGLAGMTAALERVVHEAVAGRRR